jgi:hypothetical protein
MRSSDVVAILCLTAYVGVSTALAQMHDPPDRGQPGDEMIQAYLTQETNKIHETFPQDYASPEHWKSVRDQYKREYFYMLGLSPEPVKSPLHATITGTLPCDGFVVEMLHYQSMPRLYVTGNLYRPARVEPGQRLPAVFYVCGHSSGGRNGSKVPYQWPGIWFAKHGYICLIVDTLQLGEIAGIHHGTYREGRWWWHSRGYTPAGVECLNGIRGIDYLISRPDVDPERIAVTGISGGGAATFWIAAADERVKVAVPVSGMADLPSYVTNRVINGHCDCMFLYNTFRWPWTRIAALIAPRPMLFTNSDQDGIFPMDANRRVINGLERIYSLYGAGDLVDSFVSIGGHAYRQDIRQAAYRFINTYLKNDPRTVTDSEMDLVTGPTNKRQYPISPEKLRVFPQDSDIPKDQLNTTIDQYFVPMAKVEPPKPGAYETWRAPILAELRRVTFGYFPERIPPATLGPAGFVSEPDIKIDCVREPRPVSAGKPTRVLLFVRHPELELTPQILGQAREAGDQVCVCIPRGVGRTRWTQKNPPNYVERSHVLLGRTVDEGRVWDIIATARHLHAEYADIPLYVAGEGPGAVLAAYAALLEPDIAGVIALHPPSSHMDAKAPQFLNVLRVCDIPDVFGMLAPRPLKIRGWTGDAPAKVTQIYAAAGASNELRQEP